MELFIKDVDKSLLTEGMAIPNKYQKELLDGLDIDLDFGQKTDIDIVLDNKVYEAVLKNQSYDKDKYKNHVPVVQIRYSPNSDIAKRLREVFVKTKEYMESTGQTKIPEEEKEYMKVVLPGMENTIEFKPVKSQEERKEQLSNIERMSKLLMDRQDLLNKLEEVLNELDASSEGLKELSEYFISDQRINDIEDDENGEIPEGINRAVLSEDELYNMLEDNHDVAIHMMESAVGMLKEE